MDKDNDGLPRSYRWHEKLEDWSDAIYKREDNLGFWLGVLFVSPVLASLRWLNRRFSNWADDQGQKLRERREARFEEWRRRNKRLSGVNASADRGLAWRTTREASLRIVQVFQTVAPVFTGEIGNPVLPPGVENKVPEFVGTEGKSHQVVPGQANGDPAEGLARVRPVRRVGCPWITDNGRESGHETRFRRSFYR